MSGRRPGAGPLGVLVFALGLLAGCAPSLNWREVPVGGEAIALFPCKVEHRQREAVPLGDGRYPMRQAACEADGMTFAVTSLDSARVSDGSSGASASQIARWMAAATAANVGAVPQPSAPATSSASTGGDTPLRFRLAGRRDDGQSVAVEVRILVSGSWVLQAAVVGDRLQEQAVETFLDSLGPRRLPGVMGGG